MAHDVAGKIQFQQDELDQARGQARETDELVDTYGRSVERAEDPCAIGRIGFDRDGGLRRSSDARRGPERGVRKVIAHVSAG